MMDAIVPVIHKTGINDPDVAMIANTVSFMMIFPPLQPCGSEALRWLIDDSRHDFPPAIAFFPYLL